MFHYIFPISEYWSWGTFFLYVAVGMLVCAFCKQGAVARAKYAEKCAATATNPRRTITSTIGKNDSAFWYFLAFATLVILATVRSSEVGNDTENYVNYFLTWKSFDFDLKELWSFQQMEPGFQLLLLAVRSISTNYTFLFFVVYSFVAYAYVKYISTFMDEKSDYTMMQIFIFFYVANMSGMRSAIGAAFLLLSYVQLHKKKYFKALLLTFFAFCFHYTMLYNVYIILGVLIFDSKNLIKKKWMFVFLIAVSVVFSMFGFNLVKRVFTNTRYDYYSAVDISDLSLLGSVFYVFFALLCFVFYRRYVSNGSVKSQFIVSLLFLASYPLIYVAAAYRITNYYALPRLLIWSQGGKEMISDQREPESKLLIKMILQVIVILFLLFKFTRSAEDGFFMYHLKW